MCGRYASSRSAEALAAEFDVDDVYDGLPAPDYNIAPTVTVPAVYERRVQRSDTEGPGGSGADPEVRRRLAPLTWGLVPSWAKDRSIGARLINARAETLAEKPAFRKAFAQRRCLLPADGFYEWYDPSGGSGRRTTKQPFYIHRADGGLLVMAGLYEIWRDPAKERDDDSGWLRTCTVITTRAVDAAGHVHDRMPMVVDAAAIDRWLDPEFTHPDQVRALLAVTDAVALEAYAVSTDVNSVQNNSRALLEPLSAEEYPEDLPNQQPLL